MKSVPSRVEAVVITLILLVTCLAWLPGLQYPVVSDTVIYGLLGESVWHGHGYVLFGEAYAKHIPLHALVSYPFVAFAGLTAGMKISSLLAGIAVLLFAWRLFRLRFGRIAALVSVILIALHPGFVLMTMLGSADLLFCALFLATALYLFKAARDPHVYLLAGIAAGFACLTRYNGIPVLGLFPLVAFARPGHRRSLSLWSGLALAIGIAGLWFLRNAIVFGDPLHTSYVEELGNESAGVVRQFLSNTLYYLNPVHNVFPFALPFTLVGLWRFGRQQPLLLAAAALSLVITSVWWVQAIRFAFPAIVIALGFAGAGVAELLRRFPRYVLAASVLTLAFVVLQGTSLCVYTYGSCNAAFDRTVGFIPPNMGLTSEGFALWDQMRDTLNRQAESGATVYVGNALNLQVAQREEVYRPDLRLTDDPAVCPTYVIAQSTKPGDRELAHTDAQPVTYLLLRDCPR